MQNYLADLAFWRAECAVTRAENATSLPARERHLGRSRLWSDVECWLSGLGTWDEIRASRFRRERQSRPLAIVDVEGVAS